MTAEIQLPAILSLSQWRAAETKARDDVLKALHEPKSEDFVAAQVSKYPRGLTRTVKGMLIAVIVAAFAISAGKQLVAFYGIFGDLATKPGLASWWSVVAVFAAVMLTEFGALVFSFTVPLFGKDSNPHVFRAGAFISAGLALWANITATTSETYANTFSLILAWFVTIFAPLIVLVGALVWERFILIAVTRQEAGNAAFEVEHQLYLVHKRNPASHPDYPKTLYQRVLETYQRRDVARNDPAMLQALVQRAYAMYSAAPDLTAPLTITLPQPAALPAPDVPALPAGSNMGQGDGSAPAADGSGFGSADGSGMGQEDGSAVGQAEKAEAWLRTYPDLQGLSQRKAALTAGVGLATLQRAIERAKPTGWQETT